jgi:hypothetical protein
MSKAEERALEAFPLNIYGDSRGSYDLNVVKRIIYQQGYEQAEKDLELTWEDIKTIDKLLNKCVDYSNPYQKVLKLFKDLKNNTKL